MRRVVLSAILIVVIALIPGVSSCSSGTQEYRGVLQEINTNSEISVLAPDGNLIVTNGDSNTIYENNGVECSPTDLPPGSLVAVQMRDDQVVSVREYEDEDEDEDEDEPGATPTPPTTASGVQLYTDYCARCHNASPPASWRTNRTAAQLTSAIESGPGSMPAYSGIMTAAQINAIVQYIHGTTQPTTPPITTLPPTTIQPEIDAAQVYTSNCADCHGVDRTGGRGPNITQSALSNRNVANLTSFVSGHNTGRNLTSAQVAALANWLKGVIPTIPPTTTTLPTTTPPVTSHQNLTWQGPTTCLECHESQAQNMFGAVHYQWKGETPFVVNGPDIQGKDAGAFNAFCINILGNWNSCGTCHAGLGARPEAIPTQSQLANIDCLMCHQKDYKRIKVGDTFVPDNAVMTISMDQAVQTVHIPERANCLFCHARSGGSDGFKRGDLTLAHANTVDGTFDAHMATTGANLQCVDCHNWENHHAPGRGADLRPSDLTTVPQCTDCHTDKATANGHSTAAVNRHVNKLACQTCHIPVYAKDAADTTATEATEIHRTWQESHNTGTRYEPIFTLANNVIPVYRFWNKTSSAYNMNDTAVVSQDTGEYGITRPIGSIDDPDSKLYPFKYKTAEQPMTTASNKLIALDTSVFFATGNPQQAIAAGLSNMGLPPTEPYSWVTTDEFLMLNHEVMPVERVLTCDQCHGTTTQIDLPGLGYVLKGPQTSVCTQCHERENQPEFVELHNEHRSEGINCSSCHNFSRQQVSPTPSPAPTTIPSTANGAQLYGSYCTGCHSTPPPSSWQTNRTAAELTSAINSGPGNMPAYSSVLTSGQITAIVQYIQGATPPTTTLPATTPPTTPPVADASQVYTSNCASCHGANRTGGRGPNITQSALSNRSVANLTSFISGHNTGRNLTSAQVAALANWLKTTP